MTDSASSSRERRKIFGPLLAFVAGENGRDLLMMLLDRAIRLSVGVVMTGLTARYLGAEMFGWLNYAGAVTAFAAAIAHLGFDGIVVRELVKQPGKTGVVMGAVLVFRAFTGLLLAVGLGMAAGLIGNEEPVQTALIRILALGTFAPALAAPIFWFQARTKARVGLLWALPACLAGAALRWYLIWREASVEMLAWASLLEMFLGGLLTGWAMFRQGGRVDIGGSLAMGRRILAESWPLMVGALAATVYMKTDIVMLKWLAGDSAVGLYSAATRLSEIAYAIPYMAGASYMARLTTEAADQGAFSQAIERYFRASAGLGYLLCVPGILLAPWLMEAIFGASYAEARTVARIHLLTVLFVCMGTARGRILIINGWTRFAMATALLGGALNVILNLVFIPIWGAAGAAAASVLSHAVAAVGSTLLHVPARSLGWAQLRALVRPHWGMS